MKITIYCTLWVLISTLSLPLAGMHDHELRNRWRDKNSQLCPVCEKPLEQEPAPTNYITVYGKLLHAPCVQELLDCKEQPECPICLSEIQLEQDDVHVIDQCAHIFHTTCLFEWTRTQSNADLKPSCPECRAPITVLDFPDELRQPVTPFCRLCTIL
jgi:hypothetical protein